MGRHSAKPDLSRLERGEVVTGTLITEVAPGGLTIPRDIRDIKVRIPVRWVPTLGPGGDMTLAVVTEDLQPVLVHNAGPADCWALLDARGRLLWATPMQITASSDFHFTPHPLVD